MGCARLMTAMGGKQSWGKPIGRHPQTLKRRQNQVVPNSVLVLGLLVLTGQLLIVFCELPEEPGYSRIVGLVGLLTKKPGVLEIIVTQQHNHP